MAGTCGPAARAPAGELRHVMIIVTCDVEKGLGTELVVTDVFVKVRWYVWNRRARLCLLVRTNSNGLH